MTADREARSPLSPTEAVVGGPSQPDPAAAAAQRPGTPAHAPSDRERERAALPRCCEGWIAEQVHAWAQT